MFVQYTLSGINITLLKEINLVYLQICWIDFNRVRFHHSLMGLMPSFQQEMHLDILITMNLPICIYYNIEKY